MRKTSPRYVTSITACSRDSNDFCRGGIRVLIVTRVKEVKRVATECHPYNLSQHLLYYPSYQNLKGHAPK